MFVFGDETETGATYLMNFNARGPGGEPSVYLDHHGESTYLVNETIGGLFEVELAASDEPGVDWAEVDGLDVLARETIDLSPLYDGSPATEEQVLAREGDGLVLFTRRRSPEGEALTRTTLPLPLDAMWAEIRPHRPAPIGTFALHIQPAESDGIVQVQSETNDDGRWKDTTSRGVPIYVMFESTDRDRLRPAPRSQLSATRAWLCRGEAGPPGRVRGDGRGALARAAERRAHASRSEHGGGRGIARRPGRHAPRAGPGRRGDAGPAGWRS